MRSGLVITCALLLSACTRTTRVDVRIVERGGLTDATVALSVFERRACPSPASLADLSGLGEPVHEQSFALDEAASPIGVLPDGDYVLIARLRDPDDCALRGVACAEWSAASGGPVELVTEDPFEGARPACAPGVGCVDGVCVGAAPDGGLDAGTDAGLDAGADAAVDGGVDAGADGGVASCTAAGVPCVEYLTAGTCFTCVADADGAWCFGCNEAGQLGDGTQMMRTAPTPVVGLPLGISDIAAGDEHTCALLGAGGVRCWGRNAASTGQYRLGDGSAVGLSTSPRSVSGVTTASALTVGYWHSCAIVGGDQVTCWGQNQSGELGVGDTMSYTAPAGIVQDETRVFGAGLGVSCGLRTSSDELHCWGFNGSGQVGDDSRTNRPSPVPVVLDGTSTPLAGVRDIDGFGVVGPELYGHTCVVTAAREVYCFGDNRAGQLGLGDRMTRDGARQVEGITDAVEVATGQSHTCAALLGGAVRCWGRNDRGQLGVADPSDHLSPADPVPLPGVAVDIVAGAAHTCALTDGNLIYCWGDNTHGQLGRAGGGMSSAPRLVAWF